MAANEHLGDQFAFGHKMTSPSRACGSCEVVSDAYAEHLRTHGEEAERTAYEVQGDLHHVVVHKGMVVDWTHRQYDPKAPVPLVMDPDKYADLVEKY